MIQKIFLLQSFFEPLESFDYLGIWLPLWFYITLYVVIIVLYVSSERELRKKINKIILFSAGLTLAYIFIIHAYVYKETIEYIQEGYPLKPWFIEILRRIWFMLSPLLLISSLFFLVSHYVPIIIKSMRPEEYDETTDPWHPQNNKIKRSQQLFRALNADLSKDNIDNIVTILENGIADLKKQKNDMKLLKDNWQSIPTLPDKEFNEQYNGRGSRGKLYSRHRIAEFIQTYNRRMFQLDEYIKQCNDVHGKVQFEVPKQRGMSQPKDIDDLDGMSSIPIDDLE